MCLLLASYLNSSLMTNLLQGYNAVILTGWQHFQVNSAFTAWNYCHIPLKTSSTCVIFHRKVRSHYGKVIIFMGV